MSIGKRECLPLKSKIVENWLPIINKYVDGFDVNNVSCWACGWDWMGRYSKKSGRIHSPIVVLTQWDAAPLQRCHIIPLSLGGSSACENLFLMCSECHDLAPNTPFLDVFFRWSSQQHCFSRWLNQLKYEMSLWGIDDSNADRFNNAMKSVEFKKWFHQNVGIHWPQSGYSGLARKITASTFLGLLWKWLDQNQHESAPNESLHRTEH